MLTDTKSTVDEILEFLAGHPVGVSDLVRLGHRIKQPNPDPDFPAQHPRPVLVRLSTVWDRRLVLASKRKLKEFHISRLFIREDLSLEDRQKRSTASQGATRSVLPSTTPIPTPTPSSSAGNLNAHVITDAPLATGESSAQ